MDLHDLLKLKYSILSVHLKDTWHFILQERSQSTTVNYTTEAEE